MIVIVIANDDLLGHARCSSQTFLMQLMVFLILNQLIGWLLREKFNGYPLVAHRDFRLSPNISSSHGIADRSRPFFIFPDISNELIASFDIDLPSLDNLLQDLGVLFRELLHFALSGPILPSLLFFFNLLWIVSIYIFFDSFPRVFRLDLLQLLTVIVKRLQSFKFVKEIATLNYNDLLGLTAEHHRAVVIQSDVWVLMIVRVHTMSLTCALFHSR